MKKTVPVAQKPKMSFSDVTPGVMVAYREADEEIVRHGYFRKYEKPFGRVIIETIPAYTREPEFISIREGLVEIARLNGQEVRKAAPAGPVIIREARPVKRVAVPAPAPKPAPEPKAAPVIAKPVEPAAPAKAANWRQAAAQKAWETIRANRAKAAALATA